VLAVAEAIDPGLLTLAEHRLTVDLDEGVHRGRTVEGGAGSRVAVAVDVDLTRTRALLRRVFPMLPSE
jgi:inosine-uridine nucleoside N-ribohydrolase